MIGRRRRYRRRRGSSASWLSRLGKLAIVVAVGLLVVSLVFPSFGFTSGVASRSAEVGAAADRNAMLGLDVSDEVTAGEESRLVTVTNNLEERATVTLELQDSDDGTLVGGSGGTIQFTLASGESKRVKIVAGETDCTGGPTSDATDTFEVTFLCSEYHPDTDETTYKYFVEGIGEDSPEHKDLSHVVFGVPDGFEADQVTATSPSENVELLFDGSDPTTGVSGVKWDTEVSKIADGDGGDDDYEADDDSEQRFTYTLDGRYGRSTVDVGLKAGPNETILDLPGPSTSAPSDGSSGIAFDIEAVSDSGTTTVTLTRKTEIVSDDDGDDSDGSETDDGDDGDGGETDDGDDSDGDETEDSDGSETDDDGNGGETDDDDSGDGDGGETDDDDSGDGDGGETDDSNNDGGDGCTGNNDQDDSGDGDPGKAGASSDGTEDGDEDCDSDD